VAEQGLYFYSLQASPTAPDGKAPSLFRSVCERVYGTHSQRAIGSQLMENTGRIKKTLAPAASRIVFEDVYLQIDTELPHACDVDKAHLVMLSECGIVDRGLAARLVLAINRLIKQNFEPLRNRKQTRGLFFLYEDYLIETEGAMVGGLLQTARSRNDLNATVLKLRLRQPLVKLVRECLKLQAVLLRRAKRFLDVIMPIYTHGQAAMPGTYGHYLAGLAQALSRDIGAVIDAATEIRCCPLGAGVAGGTPLMIDVARTAQLLGFESTAMNSVDAVASRDFVLRVLAATAVYGVTLSRLATDLLQWSTAEFDFLRLPDELVGSSSAMPQKRNPFLLEHIQGRSAAALGAFTTAAAAMHGVHFTNSIATGTEGVKPLWDAIRNATEISTLMRLVVAGASPNRVAMLHRAEEGFVTATALSNRLMKESNLDFRTAHRLVGELILASTETGKKSIGEAVTSYQWLEGIAVSMEGLDPTSIAMASEWGGGPAPSSVKNCLDALKRDWSRRAKQIQNQAKCWRVAKAKLDDATRELQRSVDPMIGDGDTES
jgi:argininosuccinate lyase